MNCTWIVSKCRMNLTQIFKRLCLDIPRCAGDDVVEEEAELAWVDLHDEQGPDIQTWTGRGCSASAPENTASDQSRRNRDSMNCQRLFSYWGPESAVYQSNHRRIGP